MKVLENQVRELYEVMEKLVPDAMEPGRSADEQGVLLSHNALSHEDV